MENVDKFIGLTKTVLQRMVSAVGALLVIALIGILSAKTSLFQDLWQLSVVLLLTLVALFIQQVKPVVYLPYMLAVWSVYPELRRLLDWSYNSYSDTPIMALAPILVSLTMLIPIVKNFRKLTRVARGVLLTAIFVFLYGLTIGLPRFGGVAVGFDFINYLAPLLVIPYVNVGHFKSSDRDIWLRSLSSIAVIVAIYGIIQYFFIPPWDAFWMLNSEMTSIGHPEPMMVRVFSTLNSPGPAGVFFSFTLAVMVMNKKWRVLGFAGILIVAFTLLITLVRSSWIGLAAMIIVYFMQAKSQNKMKLMAVLVVLLMFYQFVLPSLPGSDAITTRFQTFGNLSEDTSYKERLAFSTQISSSITSNPLGNGLGSTGLTAKFNSQKALQDFDNGYLNIFYTFGLPGGLFLIGLLLFLLAFAFKGKKGRPEYYHLAFGTMVAVMVLLLSSNILSGVGGVCIWFLVAMIFMDPEEKVNHENLLRHP
ncbi:O-antigen ligase family protein [Paenibacillus sp. MMO-177]|uniref:O-antigen ligase family protein n=1 Tax=Paenibacillus sp. MMO-177 TaxID=3081289 RepID=UPI003018A7B5